jgi:hypothetical protein
MTETVDVAIPVEAEVAQALADARSERRLAASSAVFCDRGPDRTRCSMPCGGFPPTLPRRG